MCYGINDSIHVKKISCFITVSLKFTFKITIHLMKTIDFNADRNEKVEYDDISYKVQTSNFLLIAVKLFGKP